MNDWFLPGTSFTSGCKLRGCLGKVVAFCAVFGAKCLHFAKNNRSIVHFSGDFGAWAWLWGRSPEFACAAYPLGNIKMC